MIIGIESVFIVVLINIFIVFLFCRGVYYIDEYEVVWCCKLKWFKFFVWFFLVCFCVVLVMFIIFYSLIWGKSISE